VGFNNAYYAWKELARVPLWYLIPTSRQQLFRTASLWWDWTLSCNFHLRLPHQYFTPIHCMTKITMAWDGLTFPAQSNSVSW